MSEEKNNHTKEKKEKKQLDKELNQTFPASDPPSQTRPGHEKDRDKEE